jgi:protocatechuate 3,4-dioxygenase beta subunit
MKRLALALLAAGALVVALFVIAPWNDGAEFDPNDLDAGVAESTDGPGTDLVGEGEKKGEDLVAEGATISTRKEVPTSKIRVVGRLIGVASEGTAVHLHLGAVPPTRNFWLGATSAKTKTPDRVTRVDAQGRFGFDVPLGKAGRISLAGGDLVWSKRPPRFLGSEENLDLGDLAVHKGASMRGLVLSETDAPVADAKLQFVNYENYQIGPRTTKSDGSGKFELAGLPGGDAYLTVRLAGYMTRYVRVELELGKIRDRVVIRLRRGDELIGRVVDDRSKPIVGATVQVHGKGKSTGDGGYEYSNGSAKTDKHGEFRVAGLGSGPFRVNASAKGHVTQSKNKVARQDGPVRMELARLGTLVGRLADERGDPLVGSKVYATRSDPYAKNKSSRGTVDAQMQLEVGEIAYAEHTMNYTRRGRGVKTDEKGMFTFESIKPGRVWLVANGGHRQAVYGPIEVTAGKQANEVSMSAVRGAVAIVRVVDPDGRPIEKVRVTMRSKKAAKRTGGVSQRVVFSMGSYSVTRASGKTKIAYTNKEGECELAGVEPGSYEISAIHKGWVSPKAIAIQMPAKGRVETKVEMEAGGSVSILVFDHEGNPVAEQSFRIVVASSGDEKAKKSARSAGSGRTDSTGRATVGPIAVGTYEALLQLTGSDPGGMMGMFGNYFGNQPGKEIGERVRFKVTAERAVEVELKRPQLAILVGTVTDASGPVRNGTIVISPKTDKKNRNYAVIAAGIRRTRTDGEGAFSVDGLQPGKYSVTVQRKKTQMRFRREIEIQGPGEHWHDLFLLAGQAKIELLLDGKPVKDARVTLSPKAQGNPYAGNFWHVGGHSGRQASASTDAKGIAHFQDVPPGTYSVRIQGKKFIQPDSSEVVKVDRGNTTNKKLALMAAASLTFTCVPASGTLKVTTFQLELTHEGAGKKPKKYLMSGTSGSRSSLRPGRYTVRACRRMATVPGVPRTQAEWSAPQMVELAAGKKVAVRIILP